jgi:outer membrane protein assembly factor BamB
MEPTTTARVLDSSDDNESPHHSENPLNCEHFHLAVNTEVSDQVSRSAHSARDTGSTVSSAGQPMSAQDDQSSTRQPMSAQDNQSIPDAAEGSNEQPPRAENIDIDTREEPLIQVRDIVSDPNTSSQVEQAEAAHETSSGIQFPELKFVDMGFKSISTMRRLTVSVCDATYRFFLLTGILSDDDNLDHFYLQRLDSTEQLEYEIHIHEVVHSDDVNDHSAAIASNDEYVFVCVNAKNDSGQIKVWIFNHYLVKIHEFLYMESIVDMVCDHDCLFIMSDNSICKIQHVRNERGLPEVRHILSEPTHYGINARMADIMNNPPSLVIIATSEQSESSNYLISVHELNKDTLLKEHDPITILRDQNMYATSPTPVAVTSHGTIIVRSKCGIYTYSRTDRLIHDAVVIRPPDDCCLVGNILFTVNDKGIVKYNITQENKINYDGRVTRWEPGYNIQSICHNTMTGYLEILHYDGTVTGHDLHTGRLAGRDQLDLPPDTQTTQMCITDNGYRVVSTTDKVIRIYCGNETVVINVTERIHDIQFEVRSGQGELIVLIESEIRVYNLSGRQIDSVNLTFHIYLGSKMAVSDDVIYISDGQSTVYAYNRNSRQLSVYISGLRKPGLLAVDPVSSYLLISEWSYDYGQYVTVYDTATRRQITMSTVPGNKLNDDILIVGDAVYVSRWDEVHRAQLPRRDQ